MPKQQIEIAERLINASTLSGSYADVTAGADLGIKSDQVIFYIEWTGGRADSRLYMKLWTSPTNSVYYPIIHELISIDGASQIKEKELWWDYQASNSIVDEIVGYVRSDANGSRLSLDIIPTTGGTPIIRHDGTAFGTVTEKADDASFTTPAAGTVEWSLDTGNLHFAAADITSYDEQKITADYVTTVNLLRIPIPVRDRFIKVGFREYNGIGGTLSLFVDSNRSTRS